MEHLVNTIEKEFKQFLIDIDRPYEDTDYSTFVEDLALEWAERFESEFGSINAFNQVGNEKLPKVLEDMIKEEFTMDDAEDYWLELREEWEEDKRWGF